MQQLITTPNKIKCINLDWLSVYCLEPKGVVMNAAYFKALGWTVEEREYGTPQYREKIHVDEWQTPISRNRTKSLLPKTEWRNLRARIMPY